MIRLKIIVFCLLFFSVYACAQKASPPPFVPELQNETWAVPISAEGLPNLHKVSNDLYRSAQPLANGMTSAKNLGIKTVLSLRDTEFDGMLNKQENAQLNLVRVPIIAWNIKDESIIEALTVIQNSPKPVLVHCRHGADRTGMIVAFYRIVYQNWTKEQAKDELVNGGFGYHSIFTNILIKIDRADIDVLRNILKQAERTELESSDQE